MKPKTFAILGFIFFCLFAAFCAWCGGYNFDERNADVGFAVFMTTVFGALVSFIFYVTVDDSKS